MIRSVFILSILALNFFCIALSFDASPLQDFCVADGKSTASAFAGKHVQPFWSVNKVPGLNTLGLTLARLDFKPSGFIPPHIHPRASEVLTVVEGSLEVGLVTSYLNYKHVSKVLQKGDFFVVPVGLLHYQRQVGTVNTIVISVVNSQNAGTVAVTNGVFGAKPPINTDYLSRAFLLDKKTVEQLQAIF